MELKVLFVAAVMVAGISLNRTFYGIERIKRRFLSEHKKGISCNFPCLHSIYINAHNMLV